MKIHLLLPFLSVLFMSLALAEDPAVPTVGESPATETCDNFPLGSTGTAPAPIVPGAPANPVSPADPANPNDPAEPTTGEKPPGAANPTTPKKRKSLISKIGSDLARLSKGFGGSNSVSLQNALMLSQLARGNELSNSALRKNIQVKNQEESDRKILDDRYQGVSQSELASRLKRAEAELGRMSQLLDQGRVKGISQADQAQLRNTLFNAADKAKIAQTLLNDSQNGTAENGKANPLLSNEKLRELFSRANKEQDSVIDRLLMFNGLLESERTALLQKLFLAENVRVALPNGQTKLIPLLHNGYLNATGKSDLDCPTFVAATLSPKFRKANLTTMDLRGIWSLSRTGELPKGVKWGNGREEILKKVAKGFEAVDIYIGEIPQPGDLLVHRIPWQPNGRVLIVKNYDQKKMIAQVAEPSTDGSRLVEYNFSLSTDPDDKEYRKIRPGLANLRLMAEDNAACRYRDVTAGKKK
ncbi:MAG: hypothetical protein A2X97_01690 [Bdellovibrionales bacterium GWA1_52_35]|nr:MAG: hypothetical protein A2X97_01690 [Bdellovibrionales bacterium GWA1_52_35]HCM39346.1 hypothetical protein [Bdellovibrionales bacterium]